MNRWRRLVGGTTVTVAIAVAALVLVWRAATDGETRFAQVTTGAAAPRFVALTLDSVPHTRTLDDFKGRPLLLNVWATWCDPCREEMPSLQALYETFKGRGLQVVAISLDDAGNAALVREFAAEHKITFELLHDTKGAILSQYQLPGVPESFLISATGVIRGTRFAADWSTAENRALVERLLFRPD